MRIVLLYDCPIDRCTKMWVFHELKNRGYKVKPIFNRFIISHIEQRGILGKILARILVLLQVAQALLQSEKDDIFFCWNNFTALYLNLLTSGKRKIISYNWLTPTPRKATLFLYQKALNNPMLVAIINYKGNKDLLLQAYRVIDQNNIYYIPDVYDDSLSFAKPKYLRENRYVFTGGRANRDWELFLNIARECPDINFIAVAAKSDWDTSLIIPDNVIMHYDIPEKYYYELLETSYMTIYPLLEDRVSGLVNIVKSIQMGKIVATTDVTVAKIYFPLEFSELLLEKRDLTGWVKCIEDIFKLDADEYTEKIIKLQNHLLKNFSPESAINCIDRIISTKFVLN